jgi:hypothetical protein
MSATGRLYERLVARYSKAHVFKDVDTLRGGDDFARTIAELIPRCAVDVARAAMRDGNEVPRWIARGPTLAARNELRIARSHTVIPHPIYPAVTRIGSATICVIGGGAVVAS